MFMWVRKLDSNSLTKTKNWIGRNEVTETSGRLHPLWPQNKWLHTPRTTDYRHTRQDRWIQTELVFTPAKNATKSNPFEIIPLQTTRKENNCKTEEALARATVTLETERIKGSNHWWLWWWWSSFHTYIINRCYFEDFLEKDTRLDTIKTGEYFQPSYVFEASINSWNSCTYFVTWFNRIFEGGLPTAGTVTKLQIQTNLANLNISVSNLLLVIKLNIKFTFRETFRCQINPLKDELNPICHLLALLEAHHILHVSRIRVNVLLIFIALGALKVIFYRFGTF